MSETIAGIRELKTHLSAYLRKVKAGETVTVTDRGTPVGRIVPVEEVAAKERSVEEKMLALREAGLVAWNGKKPPSRKPTAEVKKGSSVAQLLLDDRR